jgi:hypothetical protein
MAAPIANPRLRPARALLGWMDPEEAVLMQAGRRQEDAGRPEYARRAEQARLVAGSRRRVIEADGVVTEAPEALRRYRAEFETRPQTAHLLAEGWRVALIDLRRVCAVQPTVFTDRELPDVDPDDLVALASVTIQPPAETQVDVQYDKERRAWIMLAPNQDFRIAYEFQTEVEPGVLGLGFGVRALASFLQAVRYGDRYLLRDGYHRAVALLGRGIAVVPGLVKEAAGAEEYRRRPGMLPPEAFLGDRPPLLLDYLDDDVSVDIQLPATRRVIMIQGIDVPVFE